MIERWLKFRDVSRESQLSKDIRIQKIYDEHHDKTHLKQAYDKLVEWKQKVYDPMLKKAKKVKAYREDLKVKDALSEGKIYIPEEFNLEQDLTLTNEE